MIMKNDLVKVAIVNEEGLILKEFYFKEESDNILSSEEFIRFIDDNKGEYTIEITHFKEEK